MQRKTHNALGKKWYNNYGGGGVSFIVVACFGHLLYIPYGVFVPLSSLHVDDNRHI